MSAIEVLKKYSTSCSVCKYDGGNQCKASEGEFGECKPAEELSKAINEALLALEVIEKSKFCVKCKSKCKLPIFCNSCYQESFKSGERRGRVEELKELHNKMCFKHFDSKSNPERYSAVKEYVGKRLLKLQGVEK